jgi:hypothetical protein
MGAARITNAEAGGAAPVPGRSQVGDSESAALPTPASPAVALRARRLRYGGCPKGASGFCRRRRPHSCGKGSIGGWGQPRLLQHGDGLTEWRA